MGDILLPEVCSHCLRNYVLEHLRTGGTPAHANTDELDMVLLAYQLARQYQIASLEAALLGRFVVLSAPTVSPVCMAPTCTKAYEDYASRTLVHPFYLTR